VPAAVNRNRLLLQLPDTSVITTRIVQREKQQAPQSDGRGRD
jgi:hypothetical protein